MDKRSVFIGGKQIGVNCLKQLIAHQIRPQLVIPNLDDNGKDFWHDSLTKLAAGYKLPLLRRKKVKDPEVIELIKSINPEIIFCIGGTQLIPKEILQLPKHGCLNIHPAYLPKYRGRFSTVHVLFNEEKYTGVTLHFMDEGIDSGPIIIQKRLKIEESDTAKTLYDKFTKMGEELFVAFLEKWLKGKKIKSKPQDETEATYYPKNLPNNGQINWNWSGRQILQFIRSMTFEPFPPASFKIGNKNMVIVDEKYFKGF